MGFTDTSAVNSDFSEALYPDSRTLYPESGNRDWVRGNRRIKGQDTGFNVSPSDSPLPFPDWLNLLKDNQDWLVRGPAIL